VKGDKKNIFLIRRISLVLKQLREENNLTQQDVYYDTKIHIGRIEAFRVNLTVGTLIQLCNYYEISLLDIFKRVGNS